MGGGAKGRQDGGGEFRERRRNVLWGGGIALVKDTDDSIAQGIDGVGSHLAPAQELAPLAPGGALVLLQLLPQARHAAGQSSLRRAHGTGTHQRFGRLRRAAVRRLLLLYLRQRDAPR